MKVPVNLPRVISQFLVYISTYRTYVRVYSVYTIFSYIIFKSQTNMSSHEALIVCHNSYVNCYVLSGKQMRVLMCLHVLPYS